MMPRPFVALVMLALGAAPAAGAQGPVQGRLHVIWDAEPDGTDRAGRRFLLVDAGGRAMRLLPDPVRVDAGDELARWDRRLVEVSGLPAAAAPTLRGEQGVLRVRTLRPLDSAPARAAAGAAMLSPVNFVTVMCRFADDPSTPFTQAAVERVVGPLYPGVAQFYAENAWDPGVMSGNQVTTWYTLPLPRSAYVGTSADFSALARDCTAAADADVTFPNFFGINLQFNGALNTRPVPPFDTLSFGGSFTLMLDGQTRSYGMTWLSGIHHQNYVVVTHEMGHGLGWPHSSGRYGQEYDSRWDVMSVGYLRFEPPFGWLSIHTVAHHKHSIGWVPAPRLWLPAAGAVESGTIVRTALPPPGGYLMAQMPLTQTRSLTVEARRLAGHDSPLPGQAIVLHETEGPRAYVVDPDNNGDPNDAAAMWLPGETYADSVGGVSITVDSAVTDGYALTITRGWRLNVAVAGTGTVTSDVGGINCGAACTSLFATRGTMVTLTAAPGPGLSFGGWIGSCTGFGTCNVTMNGPRSVGASFGAGLTMVSDSIRPAGLMGYAYADTLRANGVGARAWTVIGGTLPPGLTLGGTSGAVTGIPTAAGSYRFTAQASTGAEVVSREFLIQVGKPALSLMVVMDHLLGGGSFALSPDQVRFLDLLGNGNGRLDVGDVRAWLLDTGVSVAPPARGRP